MLTRVGVIAANTYREAVRARILHGLFALALGTAGYSLVVGAYTLRNQARVVSDFGSASISIYAVLVAVVLSASSLYRELELKTVFPVLARPLGRTEYLVGKFLGTVLTLLVFIAANSGALLLALGAISGQSLVAVVGVGLGTVVLAGLLGLWWVRGRTYVPVLWSLALLLAGVLLSGNAADDQHVILGSALLTLCEVCVVSAMATTFAAFSSPFLTAVFTLSLFFVGRSADTLARLPARVFGEAVKTMGWWLSRVVPNLMVYVPPRPVLLGQVSEVPLGEYLTMAAGQALAYTTGLLALAALVFKRRDFL
jgi:ABC-type transport system involved in multi-copper enzyme maturation permease subunit